MDVVQEFVVKIEEQMRNSGLASEWSLAFIAVCTSTGEARLATNQFSSSADLAYMAFILNDTLSKMVGPYSSSPQPSPLAQKPNEQSIASAYELVERSEFASRDDV